MTRSHLELSPLPKVALCMLKRILLILLLTTAAWSAPGEHLRIGEAVPAIEGTDQFGQSRNFSNLTGPEGLVVLIFRSADW